MLPCAQCGTPFTPKSKEHRYHTRQCQLDARAGRSKEESRRVLDTGFLWDPVRPAQRLVLPNKPKPSALSWHTAVILPDPQIGYRRLSSGALDPFHDEAAVEVALQITREARPDRLVWLGDFLDLPAFGRYRQEAGFAQTTQAAVDRGGEILATSVVLARETDFLMGNHDARLENFILDNATSAAGLRPAGRPDSWPVLSVPYLLRTDALGVTVHEAYPSGEVEVAPGVVAIHGSVVGGAGESTAAKIARTADVSYVFGHTHRRDYYARSVKGGGERFAASPGCLCRIDGGVPSAKSSVAMRTGKPVQTVEGWTQGVGVLRWDDDGYMEYQNVAITNGKASWEGRRFSA